MAKAFKRLVKQREDRVLTRGPRALSWSQRQAIRDGVLLEVIHFVLQEQLASCERSGNPPPASLEALAEAEAELKTVIG